MNEHPRSKTTKETLEEIKRGFGGYGGKTLIEKIQDKLDTAYQSWDGAKTLPRDREYGRVEGVAAALGILRGTNTKAEIEECRERLGLT